MVGFGSLGLDGVELVSFLCQWDGWLLTPQSDATNWRLTFQFRSKKEENKGSVCSNPRSCAGWQSEGQAENLDVKVSGEAMSTWG